MTSNVYIPLSVPYLNGQEAKYTNKCFKDNWVSSAGPYVREFEKKFSKITNSKYAVACSSGTTALHLALMAVNVSAGDFVLVSNLTFIASVNTIKYMNADPILIDANINNWQMDLNFLESFLKKFCMIKNKKCFHKETGRKVSAIMIAHILGYSCNLERLRKIAKKYFLHIIEDAAEAIGAKYNQKFLGSYGAVGCFSFNGNKTITTGSGGMIITNSKKIANKARHLSQQAKISGDKYIHSEIGFNYRMSNIQASIGLAQLKDLKFRLKRKKDIFERYKEELLKISGISFPEEENNLKSSYWLTTIKLNKSLIKKSANKIIQKLELKNIQARLLWEPMNLSKPHKKSVFYGLKNSLMLYKCCISLPSSVGLNDIEQSKVIKELKKIIL